MDIVEIIRQLRTEKERLDRTIASLEAVWEAQSGLPPKNRKGRKNMPASERKDVSRRMKEYWAAWRKQKTKRDAANSA